jgi:hypothetical protein
MAAQKHNFVQKLTAMITRKRGFEDKLPLGGEFFAEHYREGKLIGKYKMKNMITNVGANAIMDTMFNSVTQIAQANWCIGFIDNASYSGSGVALTDTMASHANWIENSAYVQSTRVAWGQAASSARTCTNASPAVFDINATGTLEGIFITSVSTKGGTTGTLWSTALFPSTVPVSSGDELKITYALSC